MSQLNRRDVLGAGLAGVFSSTGMQEAMALGLPAAFDATAAPELLPFQGLAGQDLKAGAVKIEGRIPAGLRGVYYRNGPSLMARADERYRHWFDGDGLVQQWTFGNGGVSHQARFVKTAKFKAEAAAQRFLVPALGTAIPPRMEMHGADDMNAANTSVLRRGGRLYALWEGGSAYELDPKTLETLGPRAWTPELAGQPFSAHPKTEPDGTTWNFGSVGGRMVVYQLSAAGAVLKTATFEIPPTAMLHDFAVSQRYLVFLIAPVTMELERIETSPRFAAIAGPTNVAAVATFRIDMDGRGGRFNVLIPYATLEPVREKLIQRFMGEKLGRDRMWEIHMAEQVRQTEVSVDILLGEKDLRLREVMNLAVGQTLQFSHGPDDALAVKCGQVPIGLAYLGQRNGAVCVRLANEISKGFAK